MVRNTERLPLPPEKSKAQGKRTAQKPWVKPAKNPEPVREEPEEESPAPSGAGPEDFAGAGFDLEDALNSGDEKNDFEKVFAQMLDPKNVRHMTELNSAEITAFSVLGSIGKRYNLEVLNAFLLENAEWRVSKNRKGRNEVVKINQRTASPEAPQQRRFFDFRR